MASDVAMYRLADAKQMGDASGMFDRLEHVNGNIETLPKHSVVVQLPTPARLNLLIRASLTVSPFPKQW